MSETTPMFAPECFHPAVQQKILSSLRRGRIPHAYLFYGPEGCGKDALAIAVAQLLNAGDERGNIDRSSAQFLKIANLQHPDVQFVYPTPAATNVKESELQEALQEKARNPYQRAGFPRKNTFIGIDTIRELKREASFKLYEGRKKIFIISEAEQMRVEAANALLKLLEEPPANLMLILTTANIYRILPTIKSRCQLMAFAPLGEPEIQTIIKRYVPGVDSDSLPLIIRLSGQNIKRALELVDKNVLQLRDQAIDLLRKIILLHRSQELMEVLEPVASLRDRDQARYLLWFLLLWFQDILHLKHNTANVPLINFDRENNLRNFLNYTGETDIEAVVWEIEKAWQALGDPRNFNPLLILTTLAIKLNKKIITKSDN